MKKKYTVEEYGSLGACIVAERDDLRAENAEMRKDIVDMLASWESAFSSAELPAPFDMNRLRRWRAGNQTDSNVSGSPT